MNISIFHNMTSKLPMPGLLEGVAYLIRENESDDVVNNVILNNDTEDNLPF